MALQRSGNANTAKEVVAVIGEVPVPICGSNEYWRVVIGTPAQNSNLTHSTVRAHNVNINTRLKDEGFEVTAGEYDMFSLGGGGVHCSCHELKRT